MHLASAPLPVIDIRPEPIPDLPEVPTSDRTERLAGLLVLALTFGGIGTWSLIAPIDSAAIAPGIVTVESARKTVQHLDGGIVHRILVREGDRVDRDQVLVLLDDTQARSQLGIVRSQFLAYRAQEARLSAERDGLAQIAFEPELLDDPEAAEALIGERRLFEARRRALEGEEQVLLQRAGQITEQIQGLQELAASKVRRIALYRDEIEGLLALFSKGLGDKARLREAERLLAEVEGERAEHQAAIAAARVQIGETHIQIEQLRRDFTRDVVTDLRTTQIRLSDLRERIRALRNLLERAVIRAPVPGQVVDLDVHTQGGVIRPGDHVLDIVPEGEALLIEAHVQPNDIDRVVPGLEAEVRLTGFNSRTTPSVRGRVKTVSADRLSDPVNRTSYYLARVELLPESMRPLAGQPLQPGMSAEVLINTGERTFFDYLVRPLTDRVVRSFRED